MVDHSVDENDESHDEMEPWLLSYADLFTLLVCFFIVIISASVIDNTKAQKIADALNNDQPAEAARIIPENAIALLDQTEVLRGLQEAVRANDLGGLVEVRMTSRGVEVTASSELLFESGQSEVSPRAASLMTSVGALIGPLPALVAVEGHTDDVPMNSAKYPSNWELSAARASSVVRRLMAAGIPGQRLTAVGYAETRPASRPTPRVSVEQARANNRRVVLLITRDESAAPQPVAPAAPATP